MTNNMTNKIPCIKCNSRLWKYVEPRLKRWGYNTTFRVLNTWDDYPILIINAGGTLGDCENGPENYLCYNNRYLVDDVEDFLEIAAKLKGFNYTRKTMKTYKIHGIEIKPGMIIETKIQSIESFDRWYTWVVFPIKNNLAVISIGAGTWYGLEKFIENYSDKISIIRDISEDYILESGQILWEKPKRIVLSKAQIADKFGIDVNLIDIID